jgi:carbonic anhydrase/acetyltransferase-like protein (isoleucine patch superfamily)
MAIYTLDSDGPSFPEDGCCWVAPNATLIGKIVMKPGSSVWFNAVLRGDNDPITIGENSNVQDGAVLHTDDGTPLLIGMGVTVGHMAMLHGCTIGDNSLIGIGAIILGNARIGRNCLIGAGALIGENKEIPDNSLVIGAPGRVVRVLTDEDAQRIKESALHYVANWRRYASTLAPLRR